MAVLKFIVSACLAGVRCRFDGKDKKVEKVFQLVKKGKALPFCPEQLGGLSTPRKPAQIKYICSDGSFQKKRIVALSSSEDLSRFFFKGANLAFKVAKRFKVGSAWLKCGSPSCGSGLRGEKVKMPGSDFFSKGKKVEKNEGITSSLLRRKRIKIFPL